MMRLLRWLQRTKSRGCISAMWRGQLPRFTEVFLDEGEVDMRRAMEVYRDNGFNGPYMMDHTPSFAHGYGPLYGKAYAIGYIRALIQMVYG